MQSVIVPAAGFCAFIAAVSFLRPRGRRIIAALAGGLAGIGVALIGDPMGYRFGFWHYTGEYASHADYSAYAGVMLALAALTLVGWRIARRFGTGHCIAFIVVAALTSMFNDNLSGVQSMNETLGTRPYVADAILWTAVVASAHLVMRIVGGPINADPLRATRRPAITSPQSPGPA